MAEFSLFLFDPGMLPGLPGLEEFSPAMFFPFWGDFQFLDFHLANFRDVDKFKGYLLLEESQRTLATKLSTRGLPAHYEVLLLQRGIETLLEKLKELPTEYLLFSSLAHLASFPAAQLTHASLGPQEEILRLAVERVPLDFYLARRKQVLDLVELNLTQYTETKSLFGFLFNEVLQAGADRVAQLEGRLFFHDSWQQFHRSNLWLTTHPCHPELLRLIQQQTKQHVQNSYLGSRAQLRDSYLASGVEVHGNVKDSLLFSGVVVMENTTIENAVIMNGNRIAKNCRICNTIILPFFDELQKNCYNINANTKIGGRQTNLENTRPPDPVGGDLCLIGCNANIPKSSIIEAGSGLESGISEREPKKLKLAKQGTALSREGGV